MPVPCRVKLEGSSPSPGDAIRYATDVKNLILIVKTFEAQILGKN